MARVLLVDDSPFQNAWMRAMLLRAGHETVIADAPQEMEAALRTPVDVCLIELLLLASNGFELAMLEAIGGTPVVLMLARQQESDLAWAQALGIRHFLYRPCSQDVLEQLLFDILEAQQNVC